MHELEELLGGDPNGRRVLRKYGGMGRLSAARRRRGCRVEWSVVVRGEISRLAWAVQAVPPGRERSWRVMEKHLRERLAGHPELVAVGVPVRRVRPGGRWSRRLEVEQWVSGPYVAELAESVRV